MQILVKSLNSLHRAVDVDVEDRVHAVIQRILASCGEADCSHLQLRLVHGARVMDSQRVLADYNIANLDVLFLTADLCGGKKRKKKEFLTPKKVKVPRKIYKFSYIKKFTVNKDGKVETSLNTCKVCGPGYFVSEKNAVCGHCRDVGKKSLSS